MNFQSAHDISHKLELWKQISAQFNGLFENYYAKGIGVDIYRLSLPYKNHEIKISESETRPLKFEIEFKILIKYSLILGWEDSIEKFLNKFLKREIETGYKEFDNYYLIQSNDKEKTHQFFSIEMANSF